MGLFQQKQKVSTSQKKETSQVNPSSLYTNIKNAFAKFKKEITNIKEVLNDHLDTINGNTNEIILNGDYITEIDNKVNKMNERIDEMYLQFQSIKQIIEQNSLKDNNYALTKTEQKVFMILYTIEQTALSYSDIAQRLNWTELQVKHTINDLRKKKLPIKEILIDNRPFFKLDDAFKDEQMRKNIVQIDTDINREIY